MQTNTSIYSYTLKELEEKLIDLGIKKYVATQIFDWLYIKMIDDFDLMTNISKTNIEILKSNFYIDQLKIKKTQVDIDKTTKFLLELQDGNLIEVVVMLFDYGFSVCVTSQVGCNMGCKFCASGLIKKVRNINVGEFIKQFIIAKKYLLERFNKNLTHMVVMGIGEPFDNFDNLTKFLEVIKQQKGLCVSPRKITVSTCGLVPKIKQWADLNNQVNLAISLHASNNDTRREIMPINQAYKIEQVIDAMDYYIEKTNRRVTIEYIMIQDLNDNPKDAIMLANLLKDKLVYINLIPYNPVVENGYKRSEKLNAFYNILKKHSLTCTIRKEKGSNIDAACGQLRSKYVLQNKNN